MNIKYYSLLFIMMSMTVCGNLLLKIGAVQLREKNQHIYNFNLSLFMGLALFCSAMLLYVWLLRTVPLYLIQAFASLQFVMSILAASYILNEHISMAQWIGVSLIAIGIAIVGLNS